MKVLTFGTFDGVHLGHKSFLAQAKQLGDKLVVVVALDKTVKEVKNKIPKYNQTERLSAIKSLELVDDAVLGNSDDKYKIIKEVKPDIIALGYDQKVFTAGLSDKLLECGINAKIVHLKPFEPDKYKSSLLN